MTKTSLVAVVLAMWTSSAAAQSNTDQDAPSVPPKPQERGSVGGGVVFASDTFLDAALVIEGAVKVPGVPLFIRGMGGLGGSADSDGGGEFVRVVGGIEARRCGSRSFCVFGGVDAGYQRQTWSASDDPFGEMTEHHHGLVIGPRFGLDAGGEALRFRLALDMLQYRHQSSVSDTKWEQSVGLTMSIVRRF